MKCLVAMFFKEQAQVFVQLTISKTPLSMFFFHDIQSRELTRDPCP